MSAEPAEENDKQWCLRQRENVLAYLADEGFQSPSIGNWPAWHVAPLLSLWAVESRTDPGSVGWWVVSGDVPIDYTTCEGERHPRQALRDIGSRWRKAALKWAAGEPAEGWRLRNPDQENGLAPLLSTRAELLLEIAADDDNWI